MNSTTKIRSTVWNPIFIGICVANLFYYLGLSCVNTLITKYADYLGASGTIVGTVASIFAVTALLMKLFCGPATVSFSKKVIALTSLAVVAVAFLLISLTRSVPLMIIARLVQGVGTGFAPVTLLTLASTSLPKDKIVTGIGYYSVIQVIGNAVAPTFALKFYPVIGYNWTFALATFCIIIGMVIIFCLKFPEPEKKAAVKFNIRLNTIIAKEALVPMILLMIVHMAMMSAQNFIVLFSESVGVMDISLFFTFSAIALFLSRPLSAQLSNRIGARKVLIPAFVVFGIGLVGLAFSTTLWQFLMWSVIYSLGLGCTQPNLQALCIKSVPEERSGVAANSSFIGNDSGSFIGPIIAGVISEQWGYQSIYFASVAYCGVGLLISVLFYNNLKRIEQPEALEAV